MNEIEFEQAVVDLAHTFGWVVAGHRPMRTKHGWATGWKYDGVGWPDLTMVHAERGCFVFAELKVGSNKRSPEQIVWGDTLTQASDVVKTRYELWTPKDANDIAKVLSFGRVTSWTL